MNALVSFAAGLALGVALGWGIVVSRDVAIVAPSTTKSGAAAPLSGPTVRTPRSDRSGTALAVAAPAPRSDGGSGTTPRAPDAETDARIGRLGAARTAGDAQAFIHELSALARSSDPRARAAAVDLLGDASVSMRTLKTNIYGDFHRWFEDDRTTPDLAAAARRRFDAEAPSLDSMNSHGLLRLIGRHGRGDDVRWLETHVEDARIGREALQAIALGRDPEVDSAIGRLVARRGFDFHLLAEHVNQRPGPAVALLARLVRQADDGAEIRDAPGLLRLYGSASAAAPDLASARETLLAIRTPALRVAAVFAVQALDDAKADVSGFQTILDEPLRLLESGEWASTPGCDCRGTIEQNRLLWTERSAAALETAAARTERADAKAGFLHVAKLIRDSLADPWRRK